MNQKDLLIDLLIHDLRGPLSVVFTSTSNLIHKADRYGPLSDRQKRTLERILRNARKAQDLLHDMLEISRSQEGVFRKEPTSIRDILKESLTDVLEIETPSSVEKLCLAGDWDLFVNVLEGHGIFVEISGKYRHSPFLSDPQKLQQILHNLLSNALKHRRSRVALSVSGETDLIVSVEDDGPGIPQCEQDFIFERGFRQKYETRLEIAGLGLGLAGVKALVENMGGEIALESHQGFGARFTVRMPPLAS